MTRTQMIEILAQELERSPNLPPGADKIIADFRNGVVGTSFEAVLRAMQRVERECQLDR